MSYLNPSLTTKSQPLNRPFKAQLYPQKRPHPSCTMTFLVLTIRVFLCFLHTYIHVCECVSAYVRVYARGRRWGGRRERRHWESLGDLTASWCLQAGSNFAAGDELNTNSCRCDRASWPTWAAPAQAPRNSPPMPSTLLTDLSSCAHAYLCFTASSQDCAHGRRVCCLFPLGMRCFRREARWESIVPWPRVTVDGATGGIEFHSTWNCFVSADLTMQPKNVILAARLLLS